MSWRPCPICSHPGFVLERDGNTSYKRCLHCGILWSPERLEGSQSLLDYDKDYFGEKYRAQYGLSYEEDEPHIRRLAQARLERLGGLAPELRLKKDKSLCDVGCALGFFLAEAQDFGFESVCGLEISSYAVSYVRRHYSFATYDSDFLAWQPPPGRQFDVLSFFYVLEHFARPKEAWAKIVSLVKPGGWLLLSLPSTFGPLFLWQRPKWLADHPEDHFVDYDPLSIRLVLKHYGFAVKGLYATPVKRERLPIKGQRLLASRVFFAGFQRLSGNFGFGDTMEIYAQRVF